MDELDEAVQIERDVHALAAPLQVKQILRAARALGVGRKLGAGIRKVVVVEELVGWVCRGNESRLERPVFKPRPDPHEGERLIEGYTERLSQVVKALKAGYIQYAEELEQQAAKLRGLV